MQLKMRIPLSRCRVGGGFAPAAIVVAGLVIGLGLAAGGCGSRRAPSGPGTAASPMRVTVKVASPGDPPSALVSNLGRRWASRTGAALEVVAYDPRQGPESVVDADLWLVPAAELPRVAAAGLLRTLPSQAARTRRGFDWTDLLAVYPDRLLTWKGELFALPVQGDAPVAFYRRDLLADPRLQAAYRQEFGKDLAPPATWEDVADFAAFVSREVRQGGPTLPPLPTDDADLVAEFEALAASAAVREVHVSDRKAHGDAETFSFHYDLATGRPRLAYPAFVHALELMKRLQPLRAAAGSQAPPEAFARGDAVFCLADASWVRRFDRAKPPVAVGVCRVPGSRRVFEAGGQPRDVPGGNYMPYLGTHAFLGVVPRSAAHPEEALDLLAELAGPEASRQAVIEPSHGGGAFRRDHFADTRGWSSFGLDQGQTAALVQALQATLIHSGLSNPTTCLRLPDAREHVAVLGAELRAALTGGKEPRIALEAAAARWRELDARKPEGQARADYALGLGLIPPR